MDKKEELLVQWLKNVGTDTPGPDFTEDIMQIIQEEEHVLSMQDASLKTILKRTLFTEPSAGFTKGVIKGIEGNKKKTSFAPLISGKMMLFVLSSFMVLAMWFESKGNPQVLKTPDIFLKTINELLFSIAQIPALLSMSIIALTILLLMDRSIHQKKRGATLKFRL